MPGVAAKILAIEHDASQHPVTGTGRPDPVRRSVEPLDEVRHAGGNLSLEECAEACVTRVEVRVHTHACPEDPRAVALHQMPAVLVHVRARRVALRSADHPSELQSLMRITSADFGL